MSDLSKRANYDKKVSSLLKKYSIFNIPEEEITVEQLRQTTVS